MIKYILIPIFFLSQAVSAQTGITWSASMDVAPSSHSNRHPRIVVDKNGNPLILWGNMSSNECKFARWNGAAFSTPVVLNPMAISVLAMSWAGPDIASKGDTVYVVMKGTPEDVNNIYITSSFDGGVNFSVPTIVDNGIAPDLSRFPTVTIDDDGNPIVAYMRLDMNWANASWVVSKSFDFGNTFQPDVLASGWSGGGICDCCPGGIISSGNVAAMLYRDNLNNIRDSWCGISNDTGNTFSSGMNIDQNNWMLMACPSTGPDGVIIGDSLYSVFMNGAAGGSNVYFSSSSLSNAQAQASQALSSNANYPRISNSGKAIAVVYRNSNMGNQQLALRFTTDIDSGLSTQIDTIAYSGVENGDVVVYEDKVYVVWEDLNSGTVKFQSGTFIPLSTSIQIANERNEISVYPNPNSLNHLNVLSNGQLINYRIENSLGQNVMISNDGNHINESIDISSFPKGIYIIHLSTTGGEYTRKFIRQ